MDGRTLMEIMQSPNFSMWGPAQQAFDLGQQKNQADLATTLGIEQRAKEMQPVDIQVKQANIRQSDAAGGYSTAMTQQLQDNLKVLQGVPMDQRVQAHIAKMRAETSGDKLKAADAEMESLSGAAAAALKNGGTLPLGYTFQNPEHAQYFKTPQGVKLASQMAAAYFLDKPREKYAVSNDERDTARAVKVANIGNTNNNPKPPAPEKSPKTLQESIARFTALAAMTENPQLKAIYQKLAEEAKAEFNRQTILKGQVGMAGKMDLPGTVQTGTPQVYPVPGRNEAPVQPALPDGWTVKVK